MLFLMYNLYNIEYTFLREVCILNLLYRKDFFCYFYSAIRSMFPYVWQTLYVLIF